MLSVMQLLKALANNNQPGHENKILFKIHI